MLTATLIGGGLLLIALVCLDRSVRRLPLTPAVIYLAAGIAAGIAWRPVEGTALLALVLPHAEVLTLATEWVVLLSLFAVGLRLRLAPSWRAWRVALRLAGLGMVLTIAFATLAGVWVLGLGWAGALLLAAVLAPTDPVLASEVQIRSDADRDAVRVALTAEGGLNDGTALPAVMLGLGCLGLHPLSGEGFVHDWWWAGLAWPIGGGLLVGVLAALAVGHALARVAHATGRRLGSVPAPERRLAPEDDAPPSPPAPPASPGRVEVVDTAIGRDEMLFVGGAMLAFGLARATGTSSFVVMFAFAVTVLQPLRARLASHARSDAAPEAALAERLHAFGNRLERLLEAVIVVAVGFALPLVAPRWEWLAFALVVLGVARPAAAWLAMRGLGAEAPQRAQQRLIAWFGVRGVGTLFYGAFALGHGLPPAVAHALVSATLVTVAASVVLHGVSATPLMRAYRGRRRAS